MRSLERWALGALGFVTAACGAGSSKPPASTERSIGAIDAPLIAAELKDDAAISSAFREHYTKYVYRIAMRDGVRLYTTAYVPKDASRKYPMLMIRTPYGSQPYGTDTYPSDEKSATRRRHLAPYLRAGYIVVTQDVRGCYMSEGTFVDVRPRASRKGDIDESTDTYDTIDWMVKNIPSNNGNVGMYGVSYPGFYAAQGAIDAHPALKAVSPQAPVTEWFLGDDFHHNGAFFLSAALDFYSNFGKPHPKPVKKREHDFERDVDAYDYFLNLGPLANANARVLDNEIPFWNDLMQHGTRDDFWKARDPRPHYKNAKPAIMTVGGWYDAEDLFGALETYHAFEKQSPGANNTLVMGPWRHGGWLATEGNQLGDVTFGANTSQFFQQKILFPFFERYLGGKKTAAPPEAWMFETGTNVWQTYPAWPPAEAKPVFVPFHARGKLSTLPVRTKEDETGFDAYVSDPNKPVPYRAKPGIKLDEDYMTNDQRFATRRPDVVSYEMDALENDVTLAGPIEASLWVSTTGTDADFVVKVIDVYPSDYPDPVPNPTGVHMGGYQQLVRAEIMRGKFRSSFEKPIPFKAGEPALVRFTLPDVLHTFRSGHRIMVQIQSSWFPLTDRNPQTFTDIYRASESDFHTETHRVHRTPEMSSGIKVGLLRGKI